MRMIEPIQPDHNVELRLRRRMKRVAAAFAVIALLSISGVFFGFGYFGEVTHVRIEAARAAELISLRAQADPTGWVLDRKELDGVMATIHSDEYAVWYEIMDWNGAVIARDGEHPGLFAIAGRGTAGRWLARYISRGIRTVFSGFPVLVFCWA